jgi:long-chain fatty acid transport protein
MFTRNRILILTVGLAIFQQAQATNGYFSHGYGVKAQGIGGVGIALPQDSLAAATNPAGMALTGDRADLGLTWFTPDREATLSNTAGGSGLLDGTFDGNGRENFLIPEGGYNRFITDNVTLGVSVYGNGGMNTEYKQPIALLSGATGNTSGIDYIQLFVAPTVAWKIADGQTLGVSVNLGYQRFKATGIDNFTFISAYPANVTGLGVDDAYGVGLHLGWTGDLTDAITLGATYQTRTNFSKFDDYKGLFANEGDMDAPASYGIGIAIEASEQLTIAADVQRILFSDIAPIGNPLSLWNGQPFVSGGPGNLGSATGPGFGWDDVTVFKIGFNYLLSKSVTLRAGYDHTGQPVPQSETLFNILAPGVVQDHLSLGATWTLPNESELSFAYTHAFAETVSGTDVVPLPFGGGDVALSMRQNSFGVAYGWKF